MIDDSDTIPTVWRNRFGTFAVHGASRTAITGSPDPATRGARSHDATEHSSIWRRPAVHGAVGGARHRWRIGAERGSAGAGRSVERGRRHGLVPHRRPGAVVASGHQLSGA